jgi:hypothetical protein
MVEVLLIGEVKLVSGEALLVDGRVFWNRSMQ